MSNSCHLTDSFLPGSSVHGISQAGWPLPSPGDLPYPGMEPVPPALARFVTAEPPGKPIHLLHL